jgi:hypothetical protein
VLCSSKMEPIARLYTFIPASCLPPPKETSPRCTIYCSQLGRSSAWRCVL